MSDWWGENGVPIAVFILSLVGAFVLGRLIIVNEVLVGGCRGHLLSVCRFWPLLGAVIVVVLVVSAPGWAPGHVHGGKI